MRLDYLTVGYWGDVRLLHLQARSMAKYLDPDSVRSLVVVNNDPSPERLAAYFQSDILPEYRHLAGRVRFVPSEDLLPATPDTKGYWRQQALKLLGYKITRVSPSSPSTPRTS
ncbi:hypothetical protein [Falsiroseomonas sp. E2-1-a20]|uniref:hypothetical protein n=1 Tax=Falsiroseomonas sp. E2-1-a20 TaxID=3239300 RepID=UPI003F2EEF1F